MDRQDRQSIMNAANERGLTVDGVEVFVSGARLPFAQVSIADPRSPFFGWKAEYTWQTIERATQTGVLR